MSQLAAVGPSGRLVSAEWHVSLRQWPPPAPRLAYAAPPPYSRGAVIPLLQSSTAECPSCETLHRPYPLRSQRVRVRRAHLPTLASGSQFDGEYLPLDRAVQQLFQTPGSQSSLFSGVRSR